MTSRERMLAAINCKPVDNLPFWPKISQIYIDGQSDTKYEGWTIQNYHEYIGSDQYFMNGAPFIKLDPDCKAKRRFWSNEDKHYSAYILGEKELISSSRLSHPVEFPIKTRDDILFMTDFYNNSKYIIDELKLEQQKQQKIQCGTKGILGMNIPRSPIMRTIEELADIIETQYLLNDYPDEMEELFSAIHNDELRVLDIAVQGNSYDVLHIAEDTSTMTISPLQYNKYCKNQISEYVNFCHNHGKILVVHMCGHILDLLDDLGDMNISVFEAFTTPPLGNTHLIDGKQNCPNTCIIGGTNANLWMQSADIICEEIKNELDALDNHKGIIISSAGVHPPACSPETIKKVCEFVKSYDAKF